MVATIYDKVGELIMTMGKMLASLAIATSLVTAPVVAQASPADVRTNPAVEGEEISGGFFIPLLAVVAVILGLLAATSGGGDEPTSP